MEIIGTLGQAGKGIQLDRSIKGIPSMSQKNASTLRKISPESIQHCSVSADA